jgi:cytochrome c1
MSLKISGSLASFLKTPERHYVWIRMPNFKLSEEEASQLAAYLISEAEPGSPSNPPVDTSVLLRGQKVVRSAGCLNCHSAKIDNQFKTKSLDELDAMAWNSGCLAEKRRPDEKPGI